jgi:hypothetical protein
MKKTIKKVKNYDFGALPGGKSVIRDTWFVRVWDEYGDLAYQCIGGFTKEEAIETKNNFNCY